MFCIVDDGNRFRGISFLSGLGDAIGRVFSVVVLYLSPNPRTISWPASAIDTPVIFL